MQAGIKLRNITKMFGKTRAVGNVTLDIAPGSFTTLLGPSGCGKTTLLRILAGLEDADEGVIEVGGSVLFDRTNETNVPARKRGIGLVFQSYALWPHMTVFENIAYGLRIMKLSKEEISRQVQGILKTVEMAGYEQRYPNELSGGQQQRISMARVLVSEPSILLMDEPLSNLDAKLRMSMRAELKRIHRDMGLTIVYVTHDQTEAMTLSTRIAVIRDGIVQQYDTPQSIYRKSINLFVADFMGNPKVNLIDGTVSKRNGKAKVQMLEGMDLPLSQDLGALVRDGQTVVVAIRPEDIELSIAARRGYSPFRVLTVLDSGADRYVYIRTERVDIVVRDVFNVSREREDRVFVRFPAESINVYDRESGELVAG